MSLSMTYEPLTQYQRGTTKKTPLFLIHAASGLSLPYFSMYPIDRPLYGITNPYFNEPVDQPNRLEFKSIPEMAQAYLRLIRKVQPRGPYLIGGWSFGGVLALELAQQLTRQDEVVLHVVLIDSGHSHDVKFPETYDYTFVDRLLSRSPGMDPDMQSKIRESYRNAQYLMATHHTAPYYGKVTLINCTELDEESIRHDPDRKIERMMFESGNNGWGDRLHSLNVVNIAAAHDDVFDPDHVHTTSNLIRDAVAEYS